MTDTKAAEHYTALAAQIKAERAQRHLHAAAPELLEALESIARLRPAGDIATAKNTRSLVEQMERIALAAIAKAKGQ